MSTSSLIVLFAMVKEGGQTKKGKRGVVVG